jgi:hypothetical protein
MMSNDLAHYRAECILPIPRRVRRLYKGKLSSAAKKRLEWIGWYLKVSPEYDDHGKQNASLTIRHFGIAKSCFYKWLKRFNPNWPPSVEDRPKRPEHIRHESYSNEYVHAIDKVRHEHPTWDAKKVWTVICRDYDFEDNFSISTVGRIICKYKMFYQKVNFKRFHKKQVKKQSKVKIGARHKPNSGCKVIEFDMKHIPKGGYKHYAFFAIEPYTKRVVVHTANTCSSKSALVAVKKAVRVFGDDITIICDNGSENMKLVYAWLEKMAIMQLFCRVRQPKDKPFVERVIGTYQRECIDSLDWTPTTAKEWQRVTDEWTDDYHYFRPHESLGMQTPQEFCASIGLSILEASKVSSMY